MVRMKARLRARHLGYLMVVQKAVRLAQTKVGSRVVSMAVRLVPTTAVMTAEKKAAMTASTMAVMTAVTRDPNLVGNLGFHLAMKTAAYWADCRVAS